MPRILSTYPVPAVVPELGILLLVGIALLSGWGLKLFNAVAQEGEAEPDPNLVYANDFEEDKPGAVNYFVLDGDFEIEAVEHEGEKVGQILKLLPSPLVDASIQFGETLDGGGSVKVRARAERRGRSFPRFGVGMHGLKGYRLRVVPAAGRLELVLDQEVIQSVPFEWQSGTWYFVELSVIENADSWTVSGRAWPENQPRPDDAPIDYISVESEFRGKASITGTPYAQLPIYYDDVEIRRGDASAADEEGAGR